MTENFNNLYVLFTFLSKESGVAMAPTRRVVVAMAPYFAISSEYSEAIVVDYGSCAVV